MWCQQLKNRHVIFSSVDFSVLMVDVIVVSAAGNESENVAIAMPRALHKTQSIFLRNLAPTITHQEVDAVIADTYFYALFYILICPIAIAYGMGQIIKPVCVCVSVYPSVHTIMFAFLDRFLPKLAQT